MNAAAQAVGNNVLTTRDFDSARGLLTGIATASGNVQNLAYGWDDMGNLLSRQDLRQSLTESFVYDTVNRLDEVRLNGSLTLNLAYTPIGNITSKTGIGAYGYGARPQAVTSAGGGSFTYDANGNMATRSGAAVAWTSYNLPSQINGANGSDSFSYGPSRSRYRHSATQTLAGGLLQVPQVTTTDTVYIGSLYEKVTTSLVLTEHRHHIMVAGRMVAQLTRKLVGDTVYYFHRDHEGSVDAITDATGQVLARMSFDAFGQRRSPVTWSGAPTALELMTLQAITSRGYTGHEMLDASGTIHMNGRVYDPALGRVLSGDPTVPDPWDGQSHNRYSYVRNNPMTLIDPSGFYEYCSNPDGTCDTIPVRDPPEDPCGPGYLACNGGGGGWTGSDNPFLAGDAASIGNRAGLLGAARQATRWIASQMNAQLRAQNEFAGIRDSVDNYGVSPAWLSPTNATVGGIGALSGVAEYAAGKLTAGTNFSAYPSGWAGNQYVATVKVADLAKAAGAVTLVFGTALDAIGVRNYYVIGPTSPNSVHPGKASLNLSVGIWSVASGPVGALGGGSYWLVDTFYPGGLLGAAIYQDSLLQRSQSVLGPSYSLYRDW